MNDRDPHPISQGESNCPLEKAKKNKTATFICNLILSVTTGSLCPNVRVDRPVNQQLCFQAQLSL